MIVSSSLPQGVPDRCPGCGEQVVVAGPDPGCDGPGSHWGHLLWFKAEEGDEALIVRLAAAKEGRDASGAVTTAGGCQR